MSDWVPTMKVLIDNTTLAGAGRVMYQHGPEKCKGTQHAITYYRNHPDAESIDRQSFAEFLSALVLFDQLSWDGSSCAQELTDVDDDDSQWWAYSWFPAFERMRNGGVLRAIVEGYAFNEGRRLDRSRRAAVQWTKANIQDGSYKLPPQFRVPLAYMAGDYVDRDYLNELNSEYGLNPQNLALAAFLHRGLYYQSLAFSPEERLAYLPHSFRATLLTEPSLLATTFLCDDRIFPTPNPVEARTVISDIGRRLNSVVTNTVNIPDIPARLAVGGAFLQLHPDPLDALDAALQFRSSPFGLELREWFADLLFAGLDGNLVRTRNRLEKMEDELKKYARSKYGGTFFGKTDELTLVHTIPKVGSLLQPLLSAMPVKWQEALTEFLSYPLNEQTGMQVLLSYYLTGGSRSQARRT